ncbi:MAG: class I SAM-dependent methyltransferase [Betaproteobacteria bacterium]|nr:class I SAM-dependent methyltransferase [Betaproteobacteria bacterium]
MTSPLPSQLDSHASSYESVFPYFRENIIVHAAYGDKVAGYVETSRARSVLSLGIGHMEVASRILQQLGNGQFEEYVIVDASPKIIDVFSSTIAPCPQGLRIIEGYFETFEYAGQFDVIEAGFVLEHVDDPGVVLHRMRSLLAPGGRLFVAVPNARSLHRVIGHLSGMLPDVYVLSESDRSLGHKRYFDSESVRDLIQRCGFQVRVEEGMMLKPFTTAQLNALNLSNAVWSALLTMSRDYPEISNAIYLEAVAQPPGSA